MKTIYETLNITPEDDKYEIQDKCSEYVRTFFEEGDGSDYTKFEDIANPINSDHYINGLLMLQPFADGGTIIAGADHDVIYLNVDFDKMVKHVDDEFLLNLSRSGVSWSDEGLVMYA